MARKANPPVSPIGISVFLANNTSAPGKKKVSTNPEVDVDGELADRVYNSYQEMKDKEAAFQALEAQLLEKVAPEYEGAARGGSFSKTINVQGKFTPGVQISWKDQFKDLPLDSESMLRSVLGDRFTAYFEQVRKITLADTSDEAVQTILNKLGETLFKKYFSIDIRIGCKADMDRRRWELPEQIKNSLQQYKPSLKIRKED